MLLDTKVCDICLQNHAGYTGKSVFELYIILIELIYHLAVMMAAVIDIVSDEQRQVVRRLFRESGNVNVKTTQVLIDAVLKK